MVVFARAPVSAMPNAVKSAAKEEVTSDHRMLAIASASKARICTETLSSEGIGIRKPKADHPPADCLSPS